MMMNDQSGAVWGSALLRLPFFPSNRHTHTQPSQTNPNSNPHSAPKGEESLASLTVGSPLGFFLRLLTAWRTTVQVTYVAAEDAPQLQSSSGGGGSSSNKQRAAAASSLSSPQAWGEEVRTLLSAMLGKPKLNTSGLDDFVTFGQYWAAIRRGDAAAAGRLADARDKI